MESGSRFCTVNVGNTGAGSRNKGDVRMPHRNRRAFWSVLGAGCLLIGAIVTGVFAGEEGRKQTVHFRDIHRDGTVSIIGHFGIPIGQIVTIEGTLAKPSMVSNQRTLRFAMINGRPVPETNDPQKWPPLIQVRNVDSLPKEETIVAEGYEFLDWRVDPNINWHLEVEFMITKVISPARLKVNDRSP